MLTYLEHLLEQQGEILEDTGFLGAMAGGISFGTRKYLSQDSHAKEVEEEALFPSGVEASGVENGEKGLFSLEEGEGTEIPKPALETGEETLWQRSKNGWEMGGPQVDWVSPVEEIVFQREKRSSGETSHRMESVLTVQGETSPLEGLLGEATLEESLVGRKGATLAEEGALLVGQDSPLLGEEPSGILLERLTDLLPGTASAGNRGGSLREDTRETGVSLGQSGEQEAGFWGGRNVTSPGEGISVGQWDRAVERDARRYDGRMG